MITLSRKMLSPSNQLVVKIIPIRIHLVNELDLPRARPVLDVFLALNGTEDVVEALVIYEYLQTILFGESVGQAFPMLIRSSWQIAGHTGIKNAVTTVRHED